MMDPILYWSDVALEANRVSHTQEKGDQTGPVLSARALAIVHLAMYDAYAGVKGNPSSPVNLSAYLSHLTAPKPGASASAAVSAAAYATLCSLFPRQVPYFDTKLAEAPEDGTPVQGGDAGAADGEAFGKLVAAALLAKRQADPGAGAEGYAPSQLPGRHRPDPDNSAQGFYAPFFGSKSATFAVTTRHGLDAPPQPGSPEYQGALAQVRGKGVAPELMGTLPANLPKRTAAETLIGIYWGYDGVAQLGTPPRLYNKIIQEVAKARKNSVAQNARLFALVNAAMADAGILAWEQKYKWDLWRPVLGIREGDASLGPNAKGGDTLSGDADPGWLPLGAPKSNATGKNFTPPFPAYPSGHATFGAAAMQTTRLFYGVTGTGPDKLFDGLTFVSEEFNGKTKDNQGAVRPKHVRKFSGGLWQMIQENGLSRVYLGVHWMFDAFLTDAQGNPDLTKNVGGVPLGLAIAEDLHRNGLKSTASTLPGPAPSKAS